MEGQVADTVTPELDNLHHSYKSIWSRKIRQALTGTEIEPARLTFCLPHEKPPEAWEVDLKGLAAQAGSMKKAWGKFQRLTARALKKGRGKGGNSTAGSSGQQQQLWLEGSAFEVLMSLLSTYEHLKDNDGIEKVGRKEWGSGSRTVLGDGT